MNFNSNKRGQLGKIISANVVLIILVFLMAIYLVLTGFAVGIKKPDVPSSIDVELGDVLFKEINVNGDRMSFVNGLIRADLESKKEEKAGRKSNYMSIVKEAIKSELERELAGDREYCLMLFQGGGNILPENTRVGGNEEDIYYKFKDGKGEISYNVLEMGEYQRKGHLSSLNFYVKTSELEKEYNVLYYYGGCLNEK